MYNETLVKVLNWNSNRANRGHSEPFLKTFWISSDVNRSKINSIQSGLIRIIQTSDWFILEIQFGFIWIGVTHWTGMNWINFRIEIEQDPKRISDWFVNRYWDDSYWISFRNIRQKNERLMNLSREWMKCDRGGNIVEFLKANNDFPESGTCTSLWHEIERLLISH